MYANILPSKTEKPDCITGIIVVFLFFAVIVMRGITVGSLFPVIVVLGSDDASVLDLATVSVDYLVVMNFNQKRDAARINELVIVPFS